MSHAGRKGVCSRQEDFIEAIKATTTVKASARQIERLEADRVRLTGEEAEAAGALNAAQGRSADLNRQLEELERLLSKPPR